MNIQRYHVDWWLLDIVDISSCERLLAGQPGLVGHNEAKHANNWLAGTEHRANNLTDTQRISKYQKH